MSSTRENTFFNIDNRIFYLSDDVDNESIGRLAFNILSEIKKMTTMMRKKRILSVNQLSCISILMVDQFTTCGD